MTAMDTIHSEPLMFVSYRLGILKTRLATLDTYSRPTEAQITEINVLDEQLTVMSHLRDLLSKGK